LTIKGIVSRRQSHHTIQRLGREDDSTIIEKVTTF